MKLLNKFVLIPVSAIVISSATLAAKMSTNPEDYTLLALKNCQVVKQTTLNQEQLDAYMALHDVEDLMAELQHPILDMESELKEFTDRIEEVAALAVQETEDSIYIDKHFLKEQEDLSDKIDEIVHAHQDEIDALERHGERIGEKARLFEHAIEESLEGIDYDQVRIIRPDNQDEDFRCHKSIVISKG